MRQLALSVAAFFGLSWWIVPLALHEHKAPVLLEIAILLAWFTIAVVCYQLSMALRDSTLSELIVYARARPFYQRAIFLQSIVVSLFVGCPLISGVLLIQYGDLNKDWASMLLSVAIVLLFAICLYAGRLVEKAFARSLLYRLIEDLNAITAHEHEVIFEQYTPYVVSWKRLGNRTGYEMSFRPAEFVWSLPFEAYVLEIVHDPLSRKWALSQPS